MADSLRELVVSLSLRTENFTRNINSVNKQIREAESTFKLAGAKLKGFALQAAPTIYVATVRRGIRPIHWLYRRTLDCFLSLQNHAGQYATNQKRSSVKLGRFFLPQTPQVANGTKAKANFSEKTHHCNDNSLQCFAHVL